VSSRRSILRSASANTLRTPPENRARPSRLVARAGDQLDAKRRERRLMGSYGPAVGASRRAGARAAASPCQIVDLVVALAPHARGNPSTTKHRVPGTRVRGNRHVLADREGHRPPDRFNSVASCTPTRRCANHEYAAVGELLGSVVVERRSVAGTDAGTAEVERRNRLARCTRRSRVTTVRQRISTDARRHVNSRRR